MGRREEELTKADPSRPLSAAPLILLPGRRVSGRTVLAAACDQGLRSARGPGRAMMTGGKPELGRRARSQQWGASRVTL